MGNFSVSSQTFVLGTVLSDNVVLAPVTGIMGLAFQSLSVTQSTPFWQELVNSGALTSPEMGVWLAREGNEANDVSLPLIDGESDTPGGVFTLGGTNSTLFSGDIEFLNLQGTPSYWLLQIETLTAQSQTISLGSSQLAAIDTGTTLIGGPTDAVQNFYATIEGSASAGGGMFTFPCSTTINATLSFGGTTWSINPSDLNLGTVSRNSPDCVGGIFDVSLGTNIPPGAQIPSWIVGDVFLKNVYTVFRGTTSNSGTPAIGFAQLSSTAGGSGTAPGNVGSTQSSGGSRTWVPSLLSGLILAVVSLLALS
ncbi:aspartic peptidase domain-containing protein [Rhodocollybia butyracea]|uniref:Aspartic peptidase domain-containing protein n=1 Tax=Rhodocollybia butyracea TaxID=206335 RepID=A0A9P5PXN4_9AGAR|nr:aspartic peptidase domain-containing protein [Rhodocollybia butyracea]